MFNMSHRKIFINRILLSLFNELLRMYFIDIMHSLYKQLFSYDWLRMLLYILQLLNLHFIYYLIMFNMSVRKIFIKWFLPSLSNKLFCLQFRYRMHYLYFELFSVNRQRMLLINVKLLDVYLIYKLIMFNMCDWEILIKWFMFSLSNKLLCLHFRNSMHYLYFELFSVNRLRMLLYNS